MKTTIQKSYKFKAYLKKNTESKLLEWLKLCCDVYNLALEQREDCYHRLGWGKASLFWRSRPIVNAERKNRRLKPVAPKKKKKKTNRKKRDPLPPAPKGYRYGSINDYEQLNDLTRLKRSERKDLATVGSQALREVMKRVEKAYDATKAKRSRKPRFHHYPDVKPYVSVTEKRTCCPFGENGCMQYEVTNAKGERIIRPYRCTAYRSFTFTDKSGWQFVENESRSSCKLHIANVGTLTLRGGRKPSTNSIRTVTVRYEHSGDWSVIFSCKLPIPPSLPKTGKAVGIDMGLEFFCSDTDGAQRENPRWLKNALKKLRRLQRHASRQWEQNGKRPTKNWKKTNTQIRNLYAKIRNQRLDHHCKLALFYAQNYDEISIETLNIVSMVTDDKKWLRQPIYDAAWRSFRMRLENKTTEFGRKIVYREPQYTTMTCHVCGSVKEMPLWQRVYRCPKCGYQEHRGLNSAQNIKNGLS